MFVSRETQERIDKLEAEKAELLSRLEESESKKSTKPGMNPALVLAWVLFVLAAAAAVYFYFQSNKTVDPYQHIDITTANGVEDWHAVPDSGVVYRIQIGAFTDFTLDSLSDGLDGVYSFKNDSFEKISLGHFRDIDRAQGFLNKMVELGFEYAYITAYKDGEPIGLLHAMKMEASQP